MGQITATRNLVAIKVVRHAGQLRLGLFDDPAPGRGEPSRHLGSSYQRGVSILSPLIADLSGLWGSSMQVMHGRPPGIIFKMTRRLVEF